MTQPFFQPDHSRARSASWTALILVAALLAGCKGASDGDPASAKDADKSDTPIPVEVATLERGDVFAVYTGTASLETDADALVVAKVGGEVVKLLAEEGDLVEAGQVLARLDGDRLRLDMERQLANLSKQEQEYNRSVQLFERGLVSSGAFEGLKYELDALRAIYRLAQLEYSYTEIRAPISGVVAQRHIRLGNTISANEPAFRVTKLDPLIAYIHIPEREFRRLEPGQPAELSLDAIPGQRFAARVKRISPVVDPATGTFKVTLEVPEQGHRLKPGMFGRFNIVWDQRRNVLLVPRVAIVDDDVSQSVFVVTGGQAERRTIRTGYVSGNKVEVVDGLSGDEEIVVIGQSGLREGARVEIVRRAASRVARDGA
ncbi:MAG: efflux RND transporter periplasmic adaptor subunit [Gammaproteobacteria bacterium]